MDTPDSGADKFRDTWVPVPLREKKYDAESKTFYIEFEAPKVLLLNPEWEAMVHDELLRHADRDGLMIEGQVAVTTRDKGTDETVAVPDPDAATHDLIQHSEKEEEVAVEQDKIESPYRLSDKELEFRKRLRQNVRETAEESFGFVAGQMDGLPLPEGKQFKVDREAFMQGFHGEAVFQRPMTPKDVMVVRAEALVAMSLTTTVEEPVEEMTVDNSSAIEQQMQDIEIPDDLSGLDD